jgi:hypothetical protein
VRDGQTSSHWPRLVVSRSTCPPLSTPPFPANSFVIGTAVINTHSEPKFACEASPPATALASPGTPAHSVAASARRARPPHHPENETRARLLPAGVRGVRQELLRDASSGVAGGRAASPWQRHRTAALTVAVAPPAWCARMRTGVAAAAMGAMLVVEEEVVVVMMVATTMVVSAKDQDYHR